MSATQYEAAFALCLRGRDAIDEPWLVCKAKYGTPECSVHDISWCTLKILLFQAFWHSSFSKLAFLGGRHCVILLFGSPTNRFKPYIQLQRFHARRDGELIEYTGCCLP